MADDVDVGRLQELERQLAVLEGQTVHASQGQQAIGGRVMNGGQQGQTGQQGQQGALLQAFLQGQMVGQALAQAASQAAQAAQASQQGGQQQGGAAPAFLSLFSCGGGGGGFSPTSYDSIFWCRSRFMCNPESLSCLC